MATGMANGLLRLLQVTDSSFPVGGFAYSHGLEWLAANERIGERELAGLVEAYVRQAGGGQWMPAALAALRALSLPALLRTDDALDASIAAAGEREAGRAMGERLLVAALELEQAAGQHGARHALGAPIAPLLGLLDQVLPGAPRRRDPPGEVDGVGVRQLRGEGGDQRSHPASLPPRRAVALSERPSRPRARSRRSCCPTSCARR